MVSIDQDYWQSPFWWKKLKNEPVFANRLARRWHELRQSRFRLDSLYHKIAAWTMLLEESQQRNFDRWPILGSYVWPNAFIGNSYPEEIEYLKDWLQDRVNWIDIELGTDYAVVNWASPESVILAAPVNTVLVTPIETLVHSYSRLDSITFVSPDSQLYLHNKDDSLRFIATREGQFIFKGLGWQNGSRIELSPAYSFSAGTSGMTRKNNGILPSLILHQNYPNPFNAATQIRFTLTTAGRVVLSIFDVNGEIVTKLVDASLPVGNHQYLLDAANLSSGVYFYRLQMGNRVSARKLIILK
jgi:hypothetical protein